MKKFIYGMLFVSLILPIIDTIITVITQITKYICVLLEVKCYQKQSELSLDEEGLANPIGFSPSSKCKDEGEC